MSDEKQYLDAISRLPRPTIGQTERFARFVSTAHSWYKHLPIQPPVPFIFYLDPAAGMNHVTTHTGETALIEITDSSNKFHYTWQTTADYRRRFGHWNYHAPYGTGFFYPSDDGLVTATLKAFRVLTENGDWITVPKRLVELGTTHVSAFIHTNVALHIWNRHPSEYGLPAFPKQEGDYAPLIECLLPIARREEKSFSTIIEAGKSVTGEVKSLLEEGYRESVDKLFWTERNWDWPSDGWLDRLKDCGVDRKTLSQLVKYVQMRQTTNLSDEFYFWQVLPNASDIGIAIMCERSRLLLEMTEAMNRFSDAVC